MSLPAAAPSSLNLRAVTRTRFSYEPTTSLSRRETESLFSLMRCLRERGLSMIYVSHILNDVLQLCDDLVVLRDGEVVGSGPVSEFTSDRMISLMVGRSLAQLYPTRRGWAAASSHATIPPNE